MRCPICGTADAACGAAPLEKPVLGEITRSRVDSRGDVVTDKPVTPAAPPQGDPPADIQVDD